MWASVCSSINTEHIIAVPAHSVFVRIWWGIGWKHSEMLPVIVITRVCNSSCCIVDS